MHRLVTEMVAAANLPQPIFAFPSTTAEEWWQLWNIEIFKNRKSANSVFCQRHAFPMSFWHFCGHLIEWLTFCQNSSACHYRTNWISIFRNPYFIYILPRSTVWSGFLRRCCPAWKRLQVHSVSGVRIQNTEVRGREPSHRRFLFPDHRSHGGGSLQCHIKSTSSLREQTSSVDVNSKTVFSFTLPDPL